MKTISIKASDIQKKWMIVDASGQVLGRLATEIAHVLRGKHKPTFVPHLDCGDNVVVINAEKIKLTGSKLSKKFYHHHTGYIGGIKSIKAGKLSAEHPERLITTAVAGMLPKTKLGKQMATNLRVYKGAQHPHEAQKPEPLTARTAPTGGKK